MAGKSRNGRRLIAMMLCLFLIAAVLTPEMSAKAAGKKLYRIRIYTGQQGVFKDTGKEVEEKWIEAGMDADQRIDFHNSDIELNDENRYYVRGIRESGMDNDTVSNPNGFVTKDQDYVVAYGILGDSVAYTVNYLDREGNMLRPSETYYGNIGDMMVVAALNIDGYQPNAYNGVRTLKENAAENVFDFIYTATPVNVVTETVEGPTTVTNTTVNEATTPETLTEGGETGEAAGEGEAGAAGAGEAGGGAGTGTATVPDEETPQGQPDEYVNLDDEDTPLAGFGEEGGAIRVEAEAVRSPLSNLPLPLKIVIIGTAAVGVGAGLWYFLLYRRRKEEEDA